MPDFKASLKRATPHAALLLSMIRPCHFTYNSSRMWKRCTSLGLKHVVS